MSNSDEPVSPLHRSRSLRLSQTKSERLLWSILRANQLCGLKFRRQHPIDPFIADFACVDELLVVEIDGDYHDAIVAKDLQREQFVRLQGWRVIRFSASDVESDPEAVAIAIARHIGKKYEFKKRKGAGSGMKADRSLNETIATKETEA